MLTGCVPNSSNNVIEINPLPSAANKETMVTTLYFGNANIQMLVGETRELSVPMNEREEKVALEALIAGPVSKSSEFNPLINSDTRVVSIIQSQDVLFVTLSKEFLKWRDDVIMKRQLAVFSIVNTLVEISGCARVQLLVDIDGSGTGQRIRLDRIGMGALMDAQDINAVLEPLERNGDIVLTPSNTALAFFDTIIRGDYSSAYGYIAYNDISGTKKPDENAFVSELKDYAPSVEGLLVRDCVVGANGLTAVVMVDYSVRIKNGETTVRTNIPVKLLKENDVWKIRYSTMRRLFLAE